MSDKPISSLRQRMIEDMTVRNFSEKTRNDYIRHVKTFTAFLGRSPDRARPEDLRRFQLHQRRTGVRPPTMNGSVAALRFFFSVTLDRANMARYLTFVREPRKLPAVLSEEEIVRLLEAAPGPKYKAAFSAAYGAGLRVSEVVALKVSDVDSKRMLLKIEQGKGQKDRFAMLSGGNLRQPPVPCGSSTSEAVRNGNGGSLVGPPGKCGFRASQRADENWRCMG
jgi:integrase/recombinase XerD